jgi:hypothetical protein
VIVARVKAAPSYTHLIRMTDERGLFEHARYSDPRPEHGYCTDDVARALVITCREPAPSPAVRSLIGQYLDFTIAAIATDGSCHNRLDVSGRWTDRPALGDWWGRALWGLGVASVHAPLPAWRARARSAFQLAASRRPTDLRPLVFAALGAGELLLNPSTKSDPAIRPAEAAARDLLLAAVAAMTGRPVDAAWPWPEFRLSYANGALAEALLLAGAALPSAPAHERGLVLLDFLLRTEAGEGHLSVTPVGGRGPGDGNTGLDQQPIEVAALADACARAYRLTGDPRWQAGLVTCWEWFTGANDGGLPMYNPSTGAGFDGLQPDGRNLNQGAESTLAALSTAQHAQTFGLPA